jgi:hypothetical protein
MSNQILTFQELILGCDSLSLNKEQNQSITPAMISVASRFSTDFILDQIARIYPYNQRIVDKARPFIKRKLVPVIDGLATVPDDYSHFQSASIAVNQSMDAGCNNCEDDPDCVKVNIRETELPKASVRKEKCYFQKVNILNLDEYDDATQSDLYPPSYKNPIAMFVSKNVLKICPIGDISYVELRYLKRPLHYNVGFKTMPDDTWQVDINSPFHVELEWERNASPEMFRCMNSLLGLHTRDGNFIQWNNELKKLGIF